VPKQAGLPAIPEHELQYSAIRSTGPGGQNVNKVSSAVHLRFDIRASSLPETSKSRLLQFSDQRINRNGVIVIKAQRFRSQEKNRADALQKLQELLARALALQAPRKPTSPGKSARKKRVDSKTRRGHVKQLRGKVRDE
jgi:ribosome-associated protein